MKDRSDDAPRREFLVKLGIGTAAVSLAAEAAAPLYSLVPKVSYDLPTRTKLGVPEEFPDGLKFLPDQRVFVFREGKQFHAISAECTHLGCTVQAVPLPVFEQVSVGGKPLRLTHRFLCPCHGSEFRGEGTPVSGPAPTPLHWYELSLSPEDGQLVLDLAREVGHDFRLEIA